MADGPLARRGESVASRGEPYRGEPGSASGDGSCSRHGGARAPSEPPGRGEACGEPTRGESLGEFVDVLRASIGELLEVLHRRFAERLGTMGRSGVQLGGVLIAAGQSRAPRRGGGCD